MKHRLVVSALLGGVLLLATGATASATTSNSATHPSLNVTRFHSNGPTATNLILTAAVRKSLFDADAAYHSLPPKDYVGLGKGSVYYAYDSQNDRYYAAAGLVPNSKSLQAQVGVQDDGGYNLFFRSHNSTKWAVFNDGLGAAEDSTCPIAIPLAVRKVWGWTQHACYPNTPV